MSERVPNVDEGALSGFGEPLQPEQDGPVLYTLDEVEEELVAEDVPDGTGVVSGEVTGFVPDETPPYDGNTV